MLPTNSLVAIGYTSVAVTQREQGSWDQSVKVSGTTQNGARQHTSLCAYGFGHRSSASREERQANCAEKAHARVGRAVPARRLMMRRYCEEGGFGSAAGAGIPSLLRNRIWISGLAPPGR